MLLFPPELISLKFLFDAYKIKVISSLKHIIKPEHNNASGVGNKKRECSKKKDRENIYKCKLPITKGTT